MGHRLLRVNESVKEVVSVVLAEGLKDPRVGFVTVTAVETSPDLRHAKVFVSVLGSARVRAATLEGLEASRGYLQARVNDALHMKRTPQLAFVYDETTDRAMRIERLLRREAAELGDVPVHKQQAEDGAAAPTASASDGEPEPSAASSADAADGQTPGERA